MATQLSNAAGGDQVYARDRLAQADFSTLILANFRFRSADGCVLSNIRMKTLVCLLFASILAAQSDQDAAVRRLMTDLLRAFNNLDWPAFKSCWTSQPVVFYPSTIPQPTGRRTDESADFEAAWDRQFRAMREAAARRGVTHPPFQNIEPKDLRIDFPAPTVAVITFHLGPTNGVLGRRMFVAVKRGDGWKISHLHASNLSAPTPK